MEEYLRKNSELQCACQGKVQLDKSHGFTLNGIAVLRATDLENAQITGCQKKPVPCTSVGPILSGKSTHTLVGGQPLVLRSVVVLTDQGIPIQVKDSKEKGFGEGSKPPLPKETTSRPPQRMLSEPPAPFIGERREYVTVEIQEWLYTTSEETKTRPTDNKYVYVFRWTPEGVVWEAVLYAERDSCKSYALTQGHKLNPFQPCDPNRPARPADAKPPPLLSTKPTITLDCLDAAGNVVEHAFLMSPWPLTSEGLLRLGGIFTTVPGTYRDNLFVTIEQFEHKTGFVAVKDPFLWTAQFHAAQYYPATRKLDTWLAESDKHGKYTIAAALESWMEGDDPRKIGDKIDKERMVKDLADYRKESEQIQRDLDRATNKLIAYMSAIVYQAVELSAQAHLETIAKESEEMASSDPALAAIPSLALQHLAVVLEGILYTTAGRAFLTRIFQSPERLVHYLFTPRHTLKDQFKVPRYSIKTLDKFLKVKDQFLELTIIKELVAPMMKQWAGDGAAYVKELLEQCGVRLQWNQHHHLETAPLPAEKPVVEWRPGDLHADYEMSLRQQVPQKAPVRYTILMIVDAVNFVLSVKEFWQATDGKGWKFISAVGATASLAKSTLTLLDQSGRGSVTELAESVSPRLGYWAGVIGAVIFIHDALDSRERDNDLQFLSLLGAALGQALVAFEALWECPLLAFIGYGLTVAGIVLANWLDETPYQRFARQCYLGNDSKGSVQEQLEELNKLLSHFVVEAHAPAGWQPAHIVLRLGLYGPKSRYVIQVKVTPKLVGSATSWYFEVYPDQRKCDGEPGSGATFIPERDGMVTEIKLYLPKLVSLRPNITMNFQAWVYLDRDGDETKLLPSRASPTDPISCVEVPFNGSVVNSADKAYFKEWPPI